MNARRLALVFAALCVPLAATTHCNSSNSVNPAGNGNGGTSATGAGEVTLPLGGSAGQGAGAAGSLDPLCGGFESRDCNPDDPMDMENCRPSDVPSASGGGTATTGDQTSAGTGGGPGSWGGQAGQSQGGMAGDTGEAGAAGEAGADGLPTDPGPGVSIPTQGEPLDPSDVACRVQAGDDGPVRVCARAGVGTAGDPCTSAVDCAAQFACVGQGDAGVCRRYCCAGVGTASAPTSDRAACEAGHHCAPRVLLGSGVSAPVCVRADNCNLAETYPCPVGEQCQCAEETACMVVRGDGTTTCVEPGGGLAGEECPCAWGHVCSQASGTCLKLCETISGEQCGDGVCQAAATLPKAWGVCIDTSQ